MPGYRYILASATTGEILNWNLPLTDVEFGPETSGPGSLSATLQPALRQFRMLADAGNVLLLVERNSHLMWGGIVWRTEPQGASMSIEASGFTSYLHRRYDLDGNVGGRGPYIGADCCQIIRDVWAYAQQQPDSDLRVTVDTTASGATVGTASDPYTTSRTDPRNLGDIIDEMADHDGGPEWTETVTWNGNIAQPHIVLGTPRLGRRREDLTFTTGANVTGTPQVISDADSYAQWVIGLGAGQGSKRPIVVDGARNGRLRLEQTLDTSEKDPARVKQRAHRERLARQILPTLTELDITDHPAARFEDLRVGDDIHIRLHEPHTDYDGWNRIIGWTVHPASSDSGEQMTLKLDRTLKPEGDDTAEEA